MKKVVILFTIFSLVLIFGILAKNVVSALDKIDVLETNKWDYIGNCINFDKNSLENANGYKSAWFHIFVSDKLCNSYKVENKLIDSIVVKYSASCDEKNFLKPLEVKYYDSSGNRIKEKYEKIPYVNYKTIANGEIYYNTLCNISKYDKSQVMTFEQYLYAPKKDSDILTLNKNKDVTFNGKVVLTNSNVPLSDNTAHTYSEIKVLFVAQGDRAREGCDPNDQANGIYGLGCYMDIPKN